MEECVMINRPPTWSKVIRPDAEDCYWLAPDGTHHEGTEEEISEVRRELLVMRTISDKRRQEKIAERY
jgi:hypothetical protein